MSEQDCVQRWDEEEQESVLSVACLSQAKWVWPSFRNENNAVAERIIQRASPGFGRTLLSPHSRTVRRVYDSFSAFAFEEN